jgi:hypothetical protein
MRFTLQPGKWYACEILGDEFHDDLCTYSPIRVAQVRPLKTGNRALQLGFYHANYPEGVRDKTYLVETIERGQRFLLARSTTHEPVRFLQIYDITWPWLERHHKVSPIRDTSIHSWLDENA